MEKQIREAEDLKEKERDKFLLDKALGREKALEDLELSEKDQRRLEAMELQKHYSDMQQDKETEEKMIDYLTMLESEKQAKKEDMKLRKEQGARIQLMREVYESRSHHLENHKASKDMKNFMVGKDKEAIDEELFRQTEYHNSKMNQIKQNLAHNQNDLLRQVGEKEKTRKKDYQDYMYEQRAMKLAEVDYNRKIGDDKLRNTVILDQMKRSRPF